MHASVHQFFAENTSRTTFKGKRVLEVGSLDINGSVRHYIADCGPREYIGTDFMDGPLVDEVVDAVDLVKRYGKNSFDVVVSTEMLEHAEHWRDCINSMKQVTSNLLVITTRGPGFPLHSYPDDWWRYTPDDFSKIFADFDIEINKPDTDPNSPGVFFMGRKTKRTPVDLTKIDITPAPKK